MALIGLNSSQLHCIMYALLNAAYSEDLRVRKIAVEAIAALNESLPHLAKIKVVTDGT